MLGHLCLRTLKKFSTDDESFIVTFHQIVSDIRHHCVNLHFCIQCSCFRCCDIFLDSSLLYSFLLDNICLFEYASVLCNDHINFFYKYISLFDYICLPVHSERIDYHYAVNCNVLRCVLNVPRLTTEKDQARITDHDFDEIHCTCCKETLMKNGCFTYCLTYTCLSLPQRNDLFVIKNEWLNIKR